MKKNRIELNIYENIENIKNNNKVKGLHTTGAQTAVNAVRRHEGTQNLAGQ